MLLTTRAKTFDLSQRPLIMGVINVTPDSFSDGGKFSTPEAALARAEELIEAGADLLDVGGESTRPGAEPVPAEEERRRVAPVIEVLAQRFPETPISVDTTKAAVARSALEEGASLVNDVSALRDDPSMASVVKEHGVPVILMHRQGDPRTMQANPRYADVVRDVFTFLKERATFAARSGIEQILLDPGIGFGKTLEHNLELLRRLDAFQALERPLVVGTSRKSFLGRLLLRGEAVPPPDQRLEGTLATCLWAAARGAHVLRVHDVPETRGALNVWSAIASGPFPVIK